MQLTARVFILTDPMGFEHRLINEGQRWWGWENIAHCEPQEDRHTVTVQLLNGRERKGYTLRGESAPKDEVQV